MLFLLNRFDPLIKACSLCSPSALMECVLMAWFSICSWPSKVSWQRGQATESDLWDEQAEWRESEEEIKGKLKINRAWDVET